MNSHRWRRLGIEFLLLGICLTCTGAISGLQTSGSRFAAMWPIAITCAVGFLVSSLGLRIRLPKSLTTVTAVVFVILCSIWTTVGAQTNYGLPAPTTWHAISASLAPVKSQLQAFDIPVHFTAGLLMIACIVAGAIGLICRMFLGAYDGFSSLGEPLNGYVPALAIVPGFLLLCWVACLSPGRWIAVAGSLFVGLVIALFTMSTPAAPSRLWRRSTTANTTKANHPAALAPLLIALLTVIAVGDTSLQEHFLHRVVNFGGHANSDGSTFVTPSTPRISGIALVSNLDQLEQNYPDVPVFEATTLQPTYWQVATLTSFNGSEWTPDDGTLSATKGDLSASEQVLPGPDSSTRQVYGSQVTIQNFYSHLLPVPLATISARAPGGPQLGPYGLVASFVAQKGYGYQTMSLAQASSGPLSGESQASLTSTVPTGLISLPNEPAEVHMIARLATIGATTPLEISQDLVDFFRSGRFRYSLTPTKNSGPGGSLLSFLTVSRSGACQQFAGAFAVLARTLGLPTRVAVGFDAGTKVSPGNYQFSSSDVHAWPEVYLGPTDGWVSFEPTPPSGDGSVQANDVIGPQGATVATPRAGPGNARSARPSAITTTTNGKPGANHRAKPANSNKTGSPHWRSKAPELLLATVFLIGVAMTLLVVLRSKRRTRSAMSLTHRQRVVDAYGRVERTTSAAGLGRPPTVSPLEHRHSIVQSPGDDGRWTALLSDLERISVLVEDSCFSPAPVSEEDARDAELTSRRIVRAARWPSIRRHARRTQEHAQRS